MVSSERSSSDLSEYTYFKIFKYCFIYNNTFLGEKLKLMPEFSDFINSDDCIGKITSKSIKLFPVFIQKKIFIL